MGYPYLIGLPFKILRGFTWDIPILIGLPFKILRGFTWDIPTLLASLLRS